MTQADLKRTVFFDAHVESGAKMVDFGGWRCLSNMLGSVKNT